MTQCISRRACKDTEVVKLINDKGEIGRHIWTEYRCRNVTLGGSEICVGCSVKDPGSKTQSSARFDHGLVDGPYVEGSKLYGSKFYFESLKLKNGPWKLREVDEHRAKEAVISASSNMAGRKKSSEVQIPDVEPIVPEVKQKRKYTKKVKEEPVEGVKQEVKADPEVKAQPEVNADPEVKQKRKYTKKTDVRKPRTKKIEVALPDIPVVQNPLEPKFVEIMSSPITLTDFVVVKVKKLKIQGKDYYYDSASGKIYGVSVNGVGAYKGRYKVEDDVVDTTFPDSDCE